MNWIILCQSVINLAPELECKTKHFPHHNNFMQEITNIGKIRQDCNDVTELFWEFFFDKMYKVCSKILLHWRVTPEADVGRTAVKVESCCQ